MYYKEKFINGKLHCKHSPDGDWTPVTNEYSIVMNSLYKMSNEERLEIFKTNHFCTDCGIFTDTNVICYCSNDD